MDRILVCLVILQFITENVILISLGLILIGFKPKLKSVLIVALIESLVSCLIHCLFSVPGINVFFQLPILVVLTSCFFKLSLMHAALASLLGLAVTALTEMASNYLIPMFTGISIQQIIQDPMLHLLFPLPEFFFLTTMILVFMHYDITLFDIRELKDLERLKDYDGTE